MQAERASEAERTAAREPEPPVENRWCERHSYLIDINACRARAEKLPFCRRCLSRWQQLSLPFS